MRLFLIASVLILTLIGALASSAAAASDTIPTSITVRVLAKGAKFIGTSMGGVRIILEDAETGQMLAQGVTSGSTGDTYLIMEHPQPHHAAITGPDAASARETAHFTTTLNLAEPTLVRVRAFGPLAQLQAAHEITSTMWVIPGKHIGGDNAESDGWILELPGFTVDAIAAPISQNSGPSKARLEAEVMMNCGCPIEPGGLWWSDALEVRALVEKNGTPVGEWPLTYAGTPNRFAGNIDLEPGSYVATVYAYDGANGNTGLDRVTFRVAK